MLLEFIDILDKQNMLLGDATEWHRQCSPLGWCQDCLIWWYELWCCLLQKPDSECHGLCVWVPCPAERQRTSSRLAINEWHMQLWACMQIKGEHFRQILWQCSYLIESVSNVNMLRLHCNFCTTCAIFECLHFTKEGSVATYLRCGRNFYTSFVRDVTVFPAVKNFKIG